MKLQTVSFSTKKITTTIYTNDGLLGISRGSLIINERPEGKPCGLIEDVWTDFKYRRQGLATQIIEELIKIAKENNCYKVVLQCSDENIKFYTKIGFRLHQNGMRIDL